jgi:hypothetical protein
MRAVAGSHTTSQSTRIKTSVRAKSQARLTLSFRQPSLPYAGSRGNVCGHHGHQLSSHLTGAPCSARAGYFAFHKTSCFQLTKSPNMPGLTHIAPSRAAVRRSCPKVVRYGAVELDLQGKPYLADDEPMRSRIVLPLVYAGRLLPERRMPRRINGKQQQLAQRRANLTTPDQRVLSP